MASESPQLSTGALTRMGGPVLLRSSSVAQTRASGCTAPAEPLQLTLLRLGKHRPRKTLRNIVRELGRKDPGFRNKLEALEEAVRWAQQEQAEGCLSDFSLDELAALRLCSLKEPDFMTQMNRALFDHQQGGGPDEEPRLWEDFALLVSAGLRKCGRPGGDKPGRLYRSVWVLQKIWEEHFEGRQGSEVCFTGVQSTSVQEEWSFLNLLVQGSVPCIFEFDEVAAANAAGSIPALARGGVEENEAWLPPFTRSRIHAVASEQAPEPFQMEVWRVTLTGIPRVQALQELLEGPAETVLAGACLVGLNASRPGAETGLFRAVVGCFEALARAATVKSAEAIRVVWKGYWECLLEGCHSWKEINETVYSGVVSAARVAVVDLALAAKGVTKRALRFESCMNHEAMDAQRACRELEVERLKQGAVSVARHQVSALELETLTDPEAFLRFIQHDPVRAFEAAPAAAQAYLAAEPAQRVLLFAKLMGLVALAGGLLGGDPQVLAAFDSPLPLREDPWQLCVEASEPPAAVDSCEEKEQAARQAVACLQSQRLVLSRTRLLVVGGAPDVGKTTFLREVFDLKHLPAGLCQAGRTEQVTFELHPGGDEQHCPAYVVDTPGFGDGECLYRNDMGRLLLGACSWLPGGVVVLWVVRAGRNVRQEADEFLRSMTAPCSAVVVLVTHIDRLFEERYREVGPTWREGRLKGVPKDDPRWTAARNAFMAELKAEVVAGVTSIVGRGHQPELVFACLGGWMANDDEDEDDEFAARAPWPWAKQELKACFDTKTRSELRQWVDTRLGF